MIFSVWLLLSSLSQASPVGDCAPQSLAQIFPQIPILQSSLVEKTRFVRLDERALRRWDASATLPCAPPFRATFQSQGRTLHFLAVNHVAGGPQPSTHPGLAVVRQQVETLRPETMVVEIGPAEELGPDFLGRLGTSCAAADETWVCGEAPYAASVGGRRGARIFGGEPSPSRIMERLAGRVSRNDFLAFESAKILVWLRTSGVPEERWETDFNQMFRSTPVASIDPHWGYSQIADWLRTRMQRAPRDVDPSWLEPLHEGNILPLQRISGVVDDEREPEILQTIERALNRGQNSLVIYGSGHYFKQALALEAALGSPQITCLNP